jgi:hypothetical protein
VLVRGSARPRKLVKFNLYKVERSMGQPGLYDFVSDNMKE